MPSSTVFSYWRRDHRRSSASPVSSSSSTVPHPPNSKPPLVASHNNPPQLPAIPPTTALSTSYGPPSAVTEGSSPQASSDYSPDFDLGKGHVVAVSTTTLDAPSSSSTNMPVPPSASTQHNERPRSSPEERERDSPLTSQSNYSQSSFTPADGDSSKPNSPFRLSFGKALLTESHSKRSSTSAVTPSSHLRFKTSPDHSPADKTTPPQKEYKYEGTNNRRPGDRDVSAEHAHHKSGKAMLHLLNPMSLLARRRSSQYANLRAEEINIGARNVVPAIPDDYDPRIRGSIIHDFSAPRPRRNLSATPALLHEVSTQSNSQDQSIHGSGTQHGNDAMLQPIEQKKRHSEYSPVFKEHFEDDQNVLQVENKAYLQSSLLTNSTAGALHSMPVFAQKLPPSLPKQNEEISDQSAPDQPETQAVPENHSPPSDLLEDTDTIDIVPHQRTGLPRHLKSNASRFSFDMNGVESSTQEKLLEEKHKEKEAARRAKAQQEGSRFSDDDDDFDNELLDDLDDLEEKIPGVNVDADENDEFVDFSGPGHIWNTSWLASSPPRSNTFVGSDPPNAASTSNLLGDRAVDLDTQAEQASSFDDVHNSDPSLSEYSSQTDGENDFLQQADQNNQHPIDATQELDGTRPSFPQLLENDDDLYFDDGEFDDLTADEDGEKFDESIFDDETSHLYERKSAAAPIGPVQVQPDATKESSTVNSGVYEGDELECGQHGDLKHMPSMASEYRGKGPSGLTHMSDGTQTLPSAKSHGGVLSEQNLEAFHHALAHAANQATTDGRFGRNTSVSERSLDPESIVPQMGTRAGLMSEETYLIQPIDTGDFEEVFEDFSYNDNDAAFYDDPIIAAANAEALENDDEEIYGQEFGFYAYANGTQSSELTNGGYFGPRGVEGVTRSFSSRGKFQEPSLTPITERSEWSTRNSVISLTAHGAAHSNPMASPGLAQLVDMGNIEDEMTLSALMRLRRGAWGGSNGSLRSSSGSPPPHPHNPASNRGSFTGLSDVSPTVYTAPPDFLGGPSWSESPIKEPDRGGPSQTLIQQQTDACG
ncbi:hypothetical protein FE257_009413 [Aspergillus nanangensis]|uniref:Uncharacterized protein n=1 Tax=Aspergillus nanangensis TaxID=2582783 RepID=A0AAD4CKQ7_ASPNN|nr:hypothetical protein FE257_009413 [Aspergillus nanangensis]